MKRLIVFILSAFLIFTFVTFTSAVNKFNLAKQWIYKPGEESLQEKWIYHVTKECSSIYMMGDGEGRAKMLALNSNGKKVWEKDLSYSFSISVNGVPSLYIIENGKVMKYNLNSGKQLDQISIPVDDPGAVELFGVSKKNTLYVFDWNKMKILEIDETGKKLNVSPYSDLAVSKLTIQKPNMQIGDRQPPEMVLKTLEKTLPSFIKDKKSFEKKYGIGAKFFPNYTSKTRGSTVYVLASYQINGTKKGNEISSHSVLFTFTEKGKYLSQKDLGDYYGTDIAISSKEHIYLTLNHLQISKPYALIKVLDKNRKSLKEFKLSGQYVTDGKLYKNMYYVVSDKAFYLYK